MQDIGGEGREAQEVQKNGQELLIPAMPALLKDHKSTHFQSAS